MTKIRSGLAIAAAAVAVAGLATGCGSKSKDNKTSGGLEKVQVMMFPGQSYRLEVLVAQEQGYFKNHGLEVSVVAQPNNLPGGQALLSTKSDVGQLSTPTLAQAVENNTAVAYFCGGINYLQTTLVAKKGSSLPSTDDGASWQDVLKSLSGKKVGVQTPIGSGLQLLFAKAVEDSGATNVTYVNLGGGNDVTLAALNNGSVDVAQSNPPGTQAFKAAGTVKALVYMPTGPDAYKDYGSAWSAPTSWLKDNAKSASAFCDSVTEALTWIKDAKNADAAAQILAKDTGISQEIAALVVKDVYGDYSTELPKDVLIKTLADYKNFGITKTDQSGKYDQMVQPAP